MIYYNTHGIYAANSVDFATDITSIRTVLNSSGYSHTNNCIDSYIYLLFQEYTHEAFRTLVAFRDYMRELSKYLSQLSVLFNFMQNAPDSLSTIPDEVLQIGMPAVAALRDILTEGEKQACSQWEDTKTSFILELDKLSTYEKRIPNILSTSIQKIREAVQTETQENITIAIQAAYSLKNTDGIPTQVRSSLFRLWTMAQSWIANPHVRRSITSVENEFFKQYEVSDIIHLYHKRMRTLVENRL